MIKAADFFWREACLTFAACPRKRINQKKKSWRTQTAMDIKE